MNKQPTEHTAHGYCECGHVATVTGVVEHAGKLTIELISRLCPEHLAGNYKGHHVHMVYDHKAPSQRVGVQLSMFDGKGTISEAAQ